MLRLVCFLKPGEYTNRLERFLTRHDVVVLRARHEMHAFWTSLTTAPHALVTDLPVTSLDKSYLLNRLTRNPKTANLPILVLGAEASSRRGPSSHGHVQVLEVTTPTRMGQLVLDQVRLLASKIPHNHQNWRADHQPHEIPHEAVSGENHTKSGRLAFARPRRSSALPHTHGTLHAEPSMASPPSELITPRRRELSPPETLSSHGAGGSELTVPRRVRNQDDQKPDSHRI
jgi:hypothetical protein